MKKLLIIFFILSSFKNAIAAPNESLVEVWQYRMDHRLIQAKLYPNAIEFNQKKKQLSQKEVLSLQTELTSNPLWSQQTKGDAGCSLNSRWILKQAGQKQRVYCENQKAIEALETWVGRLKLFTE